MDLAKYSFLSSLTIILAIKRNAIRQLHMLYTIKNALRHVKNAQKSCTKYINQYFLFLFTSLYCWICAIDFYVNIAILHANIT